MTLIRPGRRTATGNGDSNGRSPVESDFATTTTVDEPPAGRPASARDTPNERSANQRSTAPGSESDAPQDRDAPDHADGSDHADHDGDGDSGSGDRNGSPQQWRDDDASANKRRRRRRGRDRERGPGRGPCRRRRKARNGPTDRGDEYNGDLIEIEGLLDLRDEGYGFLRASGYLAGRNDAYVSASQVRRFGLRKGDHVKGATRPPASSEKYPALVRVDLINDVSIDEARHRVRFEDLTPLFPDSRLKLELADNPGEITGRIIDLIAPIGKGQRGMIVSPPKAGKTTIIKQIVYSIERNNPECHVIVLLVDERPEEVTDMRRHVLRADVVASTFDRPSDEHCHIAELTIERAKRLVECGKDVVIILDGITRLAARTTSRRRHRAASCRAASTRARCTRRRSSSAPPATSKRADRSRSSPPRSSRRTRRWTSTSSRSSRAPGTWSCGSTGARPTGASTRPSTSSSRAPATRSCCSTATTSSRSGSCGGCSGALEGGSGLELLIDKLRSTKSNNRVPHRDRQGPDGNGNLTCRLGRSAP